MNNRTWLVSAIIAVGLGLSACDEDTITGPGFVCDVTNPVRDVFLAPSATTVLVHSPALPSDTVRLAAVATSRLGTARNDVAIEFKSSDPTVATVDTLGIVHALKAGTAKITATACGESASANVTVIASVSRVALTPASDTVIAGDTAFITARAFDPSGAQVQNVKFTFGASNPSVTVIQTSDSTAKFATSTAGTVSLSATGEGASGNSNLLILSRVFLPGAASTVSTLDVGDATGCGLITLGRAFCWGFNGHGQLGAVSDSTCFKGTDAGTVVNDSLITTAIPCSLVPLAISREIDFSSISSGDSTGCAISTTGRAYCWGLGKNGQIGNGNTADRGAATLVTTALAFTSISVGGNHTCALATGGTAYCWGDDTFGQLGDNRTVSSTTPIPVSGGGGPAVFASISAGFRHSCGVTAAGAGFCWGSNEFGQLGDGSTGGFSDTPVGVAGGFTWAFISAGGDHTCGITTAGSAMCWGDNASAQLGNGGVSGPVPVPGAVAGAPAFTRISASTGTRTLAPPALVNFNKAGRGHTCGLTAAGAVFCWGDDSDLQLGRGQFSGSNGVGTTAVQVVQGERAAGVTFTSISTGSRHSCAVGSDGNAYCWGSNVGGALGNTLQAAFRGQPQKVATPR
ncbi:MAG: Ig-like domain-containing protein [Gemmatimonadales bacterium]